MLNNEFSHLHAVSVEKALPSAFPCFHFNSRQTHDFQWASKYLQFNPWLPTEKSRLRTVGEVKNSLWVEVLCCGSSTFALYKICRSHNTNILKISKFYFWALCVLAN